MERRGAVQYGDGIGDDDLEPNKFCYMIDLQRSGRAVP